MKMQIKFMGGEEIQRRLEMLPREIAGEPMREAAMVGAEVIRQEAVRNAEAHRKSGDLAGDIHAELAKEDIGAKVTVRIGPGRKGWYGRLLEMGHAVVRGGRLRAKKSPGKAVGQVPPYPWLRPALDAKKEEAQQAMGEELERRLERIWPRK